jgi:hypothetical protein
MTNETTHAVGAPLERGVRPLEWTAARKRDNACRYDHCIADTPFGRFLLSWKGWKAYPLYTADETPWNEWAGTWDTLDEAQRECEAEFARRLQLCLRPNVKLTGGEAVRLSGS